jgi:hypothetical protein
MSKKINKFQKIIAEIIYLFLISFFCYTAVNKMLNIDSFRTNLIKTSIFSMDLANIFSVFVIALEVVIILLLLFYKKFGLRVFILTMIVFSVYISFLRFKGLYEVCGCGGVLNGLSFSYHLLINMSLIIGAIYSFYVCNILGDEK